MRSVRIACEEKGVAYRLTPARPHSPEVDCIHPLGKIPVMRYGDFQLFESKAIASFVDRAFPGPKLIPKDAMLCGKVEQWVSVANTAIFPVLLGYLLCYFFPKTPDAGASFTYADMNLLPVLAYLSACKESRDAGQHREPFAIF